MPDGTRIAPLRVLERRLKVNKQTGSNAWRCGDIMRKHITDRLSIICALLRRLPQGGAKRFLPLLCTYHLPVPWHHMANACTRGFKIHPELSLQHCVSHVLPYKGFTLQAHMPLTVLR